MTRAAEKRCYCGRSEPHEDAYHSWMVPSRAELAEHEMFERVIAKIQSLSTKGKYPPDQIVDILRREFDRDA
jgi:hypothetical protein